MGLRTIIVFWGLLLPLAASAQAPIKARMAEIVGLEKQAQHCGLGRNSPELVTFNKNGTRLVSEAGDVDSFVEMLCLRFGCVDDAGKTRQALAVARPADCAAFLQRFRAMRMTRPEWTPAEGIR